MERRLQPAEPLSRSRDGLGETLRSERLEEVVHRVNLERAHRVLVGEIALEARTHAELAGHGIGELVVLEDVAADGEDGIAGGAYDARGIGALQRHDVGGHANLSSSLRLGVLEGATGAAR